MLSSLSRLWKPKPLRSTLAFDEAYCHSAGEDFEAKIYDIQKGTTEIIFNFGDFPRFMETHFYGNPHIPEEPKRSLEQEGSAFCAQIVQDNPYLCTDDVKADGSILFCSDTLMPLRSRKRLSRFTRGAIAFGILQPGSPAPTFNVIWATMYQTR